MTGAPSDEDASVDELREAVEHMYGEPSRFVEAAEDDERFNGEVVWLGPIAVGRSLAAAPCPGRGAVPEATTRIPRLAATRGACGIAGEARIEAASARALYAGARSYRPVKTILQHNLDQCSPPLVPLRS